MARIMRLGELIDTLERKLSRLTPDATIHFDFVNFFPLTRVHSYRGFYDHLALSYSNEGKAPLARILLEELKAADGKDFTGYKGGEYTMSRNTPIWIAMPSEVGSTGVIDVKEYGGDIILETGHVDYA
jgi:hypothetical protein